MRSFAATVSCLLLASASALGQPRNQVAPERYAHLVPRAGGGSGWLFSNLYYESNNRSMRGPFDPRPESGCENARRQRAIAARVRGLFVLRDALFSQQDHPVEHRACALMMPANWVTAAAADAAAGIALRGVARPALDDDAAWAALASEAAMFGSFPGSRRLFETARRPLAGASASERAQTDNARRNVHALAREAQALIDAAPRGARAVAEAGAERIAASDRAYFGEALRRERVVVLAVENPNEHERRDEQKGFPIWGREVSRAVLTMVRDAVLARRLADGDLALERYDLREASERRRAVTVLEALVPRGSTGPRVWVWVGGPIREGTEVVEDASDRLPAFLEELDRAAIARERVVVFNRPSLRLARERAAFEPAVERTRALGLPLSVNANSESLRRAFRR
ncbi:MAG: hypothetical protein KF729_30320 [Sandaracinaceae bacterium]|nr:hypothetical protein [Sandaracinaceae bacterium]